MAAAARSSLVAVFVCCWYWGMAAWFQGRVRQLGFRWGGVGRLTECGYRQVVV